MALIVFLKLLIALLLVANVMALTPSWMITSPKILKKDAKPNAKVLSTQNVNSFLECSFTCTQNADCLTFAYNGKICDLYTFVQPKPTQMYVDAPGYTTYKARNKVFKTIAAGYHYADGNAGCKSTYGGQLANPSDLESFLTFSEIHRQLSKTVPSCVGFLTGLFTNRRDGIFQWMNGDTIDAVNGTGFQRWYIGKEPKLYKTANANVRASCRPGGEFGHWEEITVDTLAQVVCEMMWD